MNDFKVKVVESNGDISIYTNATSVNVDNDKILVDYEDQKAMHRFSDTEEVMIKKNT